MENEATLCLQFLLLLALGFVTIIVYKWLSSPKKTTRPPLPPGPLGYPIVGCIPHMLKNKPVFRWILQFMQDNSIEIACIRLGSTHVIPVTSSELAREFLKKQDAIFASRPDCMSGRLTSHGYLMVVLSPFGDQWKKMRRVLVSEVLSPPMHQWQHGKRCEEADHLIRYVFNQCKDPLKGGAVNVRVAARHYCGNVIRKLVFGKRFFGSGTEDGGPGVEEEEHVDGLFTLLGYTYGFSIADLAPWLEVFDFDGHKKILRNAMESVVKYHDPEISKRVETWRKGLRNVKEDVLDVLINLKDSDNNPLLTIQEIKAQIVEILLSAVDNPSNALEWALAEMINQPGLLQRAIEELDEVVGKDRFVQESDLPRLNFVKACAKEALRLHPIAPFNVPHVSTEDTVVGGYFIPKGSYVLLSRTGLGRNPKDWQDPLRYNPERHLVDPSLDVKLTDNELHMISFSTGRRGCAGVLLGSTITEILFARLLQCFDWTSCDGRPIDSAESQNNQFMAKSLVVAATPRLDQHLYAQLFE